MNTYENRQLLPMPFPKTLTEMTNAELTKLLIGKFNYNVLIPGLIEANLRKDMQIAELTKRITFLEERTLKKAGRKRQTFYLNGTELTDEELIYLIDYGYYNSIGKLEKDVGAGKNQLRNRYNKAKKKLIQEKKVQSYGNR